MEFSVNLKIRITKVLSIFVLNMLVTDLGKFFSVSWCRCRHVNIIIIIKLFISYSPSGVSVCKYFFFLFHKFSYFVIRFLNYIFFVIFVIRFYHIFINWKSDNNVRRNNDKKIWFKNLSFLPIKRNKRYGMSQADSVLIKLWYILTCHSPCKNRK